MYQELTIVGNAGADAEMRYTPSGVPVTTFSVATSRRVKDQEVTTWHRVTCWNKLAEVTGEYVQRGDRAGPRARGRGGPAAGRGGARHPPDQ